jgi:hypothetical protein
MSRWLALTATVLLAGCGGDSPLVGTWHASNGADLTIRTGTTDHSLTARLPTGCDLVLTESSDGMSAQLTTCVACTPGSLIVLHASLSIDAMGQLVVTQEVVNDSTAQTLMTCTSFNSMTITSTYSR